MMTRQFRLFFRSSVLDFSLPLHICGTNIGHCFLVFLIVVYLLATKTVLGKLCFLPFKVRYVVPIIAGMLYYHVCLQFRSLSFAQDLQK
tara:strand:- start:296 stop:562 length:267 start_codon:yes stop_codon:yes gene_type:complete